MSEQVRDLKERESKVLSAQELASRYSTREAAIKAREWALQKQEEEIQKTAAAAQYARSEADAVWKSQKV